MSLDGSGRKRVGDGVEILYSGMPEGEPHVQGVAFILSPKNTEKFFLELRPLNERIITTRLQMKHGSMTIVQGYAPTNYSLEDDNDLRYYSLKTELEGVQTHDVLVVMGDLNNKIGNENAGLERPMGKYKWQMQKVGKRGKNE